MSKDGRVNFVLGNSRYNKLAVLAMKKEVTMTDIIKSATDLMCYLDDGNNTLFVKKEGEAPTRIVLI